MIKSFVRLGAIFIAVFFNILAETLSIPVDLEISSFRNAVAS